MPKRKRNAQYRTLEVHVRMGHHLRPVESGKVRLISTVAETRRTRREFTELVSSTIYIIGGWVDPTDGKRGRMWWLAMFALYGFLAAHLVGAGQWRFEYMAHGFTMLLVLFLMAFILGLLAEIKRIKRLRSVDNNAQVTLLTG